MSYLDPKFILIVDDNRNNLSVLSQALKAAGYKVRVAIDGEDAIAQVERALPELILLDIQMPKMDGFETCRRLKENPATQTIPVIFMTALSDTTSKVKGLSLGAVDYIVKPFDQAEVLARVKVHWQLKQLTDSLEQQVEERTAALRQAQVTVVQREKLSALGQLVAGVAHEINNPLSFIVSNIAPAQDYLAEITQVLKLYQQHTPQLDPEIAAQIHAADPEFMLEDLGKILGSMQLGARRIKDISASLRNFARLDNNSPIETDLHEDLENTLLLLRHRLKDQGNRAEITVVKHYGDLPKVLCYPGPMNQVFMNLIANAIDALEEAWNQDHRTLTLSITTEVSPQRTIIIRIADSGLGIPEAIQSRLFEPLFTTKGVGQGTGLGLSIAQQIIQDQHQGQITCQSIVGQGTEFYIEIPLVQR